VFQEEFMESKMEDKLEPRDYQLALDVQNAVNLTGVVIAFAEVLKRILRVTKSTDKTNRHPIAVMYASKIGSLTRHHDALEFTNAYDRCQDMANSRCPRCGLELDENWFCSECDAMPAWME